ncbi:hypothetical protein [Planomonospora sp. ID82291]|uniref:hypothetical protein n=1 Tax=Planomonospora sp. ID82291 TaxID=2738136 RepID=UPI0018C40A7E|nr:hypothetical protein [Planomonospora sp. ID82291]MBG0819039.1 hypothetical protein [Planomonospora sp. ID82291]
MTREYGTGGSVQFQTRVPEALKRRYHEAAKARGISLSLYLEQLIELDPLAPKAPEKPLELTG